MHNLKGIFKKKGLEDIAPFTEGAPKGLLRRMDHVKCAACQNLLVLRSEGKLAWEEVGLLVQKTPRKKESTCIHIWGVYKIEFTDTQITLSEADDHDNWNPTQVVPLRSVLALAPAPSKNIDDIAASAPTPLESESPEAEIEITSMKSTHVLDGLMQSINEAREQRALYEIAEQGISDQVETLYKNGHMSNVVSAEVPMRIFNLNESLLVVSFLPNAAPMLTLVRDIESLDSLRSGIMI